MAPVWQETKDLARKAQVRKLLCVWMYVRMCLCVLECVCNACLRCVAPHNAYDAYTHEYTHAHDRPRSAATRRSASPSGRKATACWGTRPRAASRAPASSSPSQRPSAVCVLCVCVRLSLCSQPHSQSGGGKVKHGHFGTHSRTNPIHLMKHTCVSCVCACF